MGDNVQSLIDHRLSTLRINISGSRFEISTCTLAQHVTTRLGKIATSSINEASELCDGFFPESQEYFFERSPAIFACILSYYRTGKLHLHETYSSCVVEILQELEFWMIDPEKIAPCCYDKLPHVVGHVGDNAVSTEKRFLGNIRNRIWNQMNHPQHNIVGRCYLFFLFLIILLSTIVVILNSYDYFQPTNYIFDQMINSTSTYAELPTRIQILQDLNHVCAFLLTADFLLRLFCAPVWWRFLLSPWSFIDIATFAPTDVFWILYAAGAVKTLHSLREGMFAIRLLCILQMAKFMRFSKECRLVVLTLMQSLTDLVFFIILTIITVVLLATLMYLLENHIEGNQFPNIPTAMYWSFITLTTVGYGDVVPLGTAGRILGCVTTCLGVLVLAMPVSVIVSKFSKMYNNLNMQRDWELAKTQAVTMDKKPRCFEQ